MRNVSKVPATLFATGMAALLLGCMVLPNTAQAGVELSSDKPSYSDKLAAVHNSFGKDVVVRSDFSIDEMEKLQSTVKNNSVEIENLKKIIKDQARHLELFRGRGVLQRQLPRLQALGFCLILERPLDLVFLIVGGQVLDLFGELGRFQQVLLQRFFVSGFLSQFFNGHGVLFDLGNGRWIWIIKDLSDAKNRVKPGLSGLQNHSGSSENSSVVLMQAPNIGPLAEDLYACLHQIYKKRMTSPTTLIL